MGARGEREREERSGGTEREDGRHVARKPRMDAGDDACGARRGKTEKGEGRRLTGGARRGFLFYFLFFPGLGHIKGCVITSVILL